MVKFISSFLQINLENLSHKEVLKTAINNDHNKTEKPEVQGQILTNFLNFPVLLILTKNVFILIA